MPLLDVCRPALGFDYEIVPSKRKTAAIHVKAGGVQVRIPYGVDRDWAHDFVASKQQWINKKLIQQQASVNRVPSLEMGSQLMWLGRRRTLVFKSSLRHALDVNDNEIVFFAPNLPTHQQILSTLQAYFKHEAKKLLVHLSHEKAALLNVEDHIQQVAFRRTKSKWGHCTSQGRIQYNWLIMGAPMEVIEYLVCHEVCHLLELNHSKKFWNLVASICPDFKQHQKWLKDNGIELSWC